MTTLVIKSLAILTLLSNCFILLSVIYLIFRSFGKIGLVENIIKFFRNHALAFALTVALTATSGSLFFSEVALLSPCKLCWFQRIFMYPQALILGIALYFKDISVRKYIIPMCIVGGTISIYNYYLQLFPPAASLCAINAVDSCSEKIYMQYGYITFAVMALTASLLILIFMLLVHKTFSGSGKSQSGKN